MSSTAKKQPMEVLGKEISTQLKGFNSLQVQNQNLASVDMFTKATLKHIKVDPKSNQRFTLLANLGIAYKSLFIRFGQLKAIDDAISHLGQALKDAPNHPNQHNHLSALSASYQLRFGLLGEAKDAELAVEQDKEAVRLAASNNDRYLQLAGLAHSQAKLAEGGQDVALQGDAINNLLQAIQLAPQRHPDLPEWHINLGDWYYSRSKISSTTKRADITEATNHWDQAVVLAKGQTKPSAQLSAALGYSYMARTKINSPTDQKNLIESAIRHFLVADKGAPHDHPDRSLWLTRLALAYQLGASILGHDKTIPNMRRAADFLQRAASSPSGRPLDRIRACEHLAKLDYSSDENAIQGKNFAYNTALRLATRLIWIGESIEQRYKGAGLIAGLARGAAAFAFSQNRPDQAIKWLEMGRGVILRQTTQLLPRFVKLPPNIDKSLSQCFRDVSQELGGFLMASTNGFATEEIKQKVHRLAEEYEELTKKIPEIHGISGLRPKTIEEYLTLVNSVGTVLIEINCHKSGSHVAAFLPGSAGFLSFELKPIGNLSVHDELEKARNDLNEALLNAGIRQRTNMSSGNNSKHRPMGIMQTKKGKAPPRPTIEDVLVMLWELVAKPILNCLNYQRRVLPDGTPDVNKMPLITWCGTGPLSFLPLHAAGNYKNQNSGSRDMVADYVVSSYTPTLHLWACMAALPLTSHQNISMLAIAQAKTDGYSDLLGTKEELKNIKNAVNRYNSKNQSSQQNITLTTLTNKQVMLNTVLDHLGKHYLVHIACHAIQDITDPLKSAIILQQKGQLTVGQLLKSPLQDYNRYIFLSACETSKGNLQSDEPFHLAAAMLFRFFGVIATRWAIHDEDAPLVAKVAYEMLFKNGWNDCGALAKALHIAVYKLWNSKNVGLSDYTRWVCFVHFGF
ncbi:hypothetical protein CTheo_8160 [Ceratobasidium theobromae]|uniref:CHAT domain-containing protein n=1 Tax=Ceratobasidium theobromae TaxID=1582974 RepID=A0A5N5QAD2_9AGAM|nr:hypothetical protein CTheo_8160 [Ceratobasidium theobromae]